MPSSVDSMLISVFKYELINRLELLPKTTESDIIVSYFKTRIKELETN